MNPIYLRRVAIDEFRAFGPGFELELPDGPSVTILTGVNGVGKTALMDAIEWGLTGQVHRLGSLSDARLFRDQRDYVDRRRDRRREPFDVSVKLDFAVDSIARTARYSPDGRVISVEHPASDQITTLLQSDAWSGELAPESVAPYLRSTHFLCQSVIGRWDGETPSARWGSISGLLGADLLDRAHRNLASPAVAHAFGPQRESLDRELQRRLALLEEWRLLVGERDRLRQTADAQGAISPQGLRSVVGDAMERLEKRFGIAPAPGAAREADPLVLLEEFRNQLDRCSDEVTRRQGQLYVLSEVVREWDEAGSTLARVNGEIELARERVETEEQALSTARAAKSEGEEHLHIRETERNTAQERLDRLKAVADALDTGVEAASRRQAMDQTRTRLENRDRALKDERQKAEKDVNYRHGRIAENERLRQRRQRLTTLIEKAQALKAERGELPVLRSRLEANQATAGRLSEEVDEAAGTVRQLEQEIAEAEQRIDHLRSEADALSQALAVVASRIGPEDTACPLCSHTWPVGELKQQADRAAGATSGILAAAEQEVTGKRSGLDSALERLTRLRAGLTDANAGRESLQARIDAFDRGLSELLSEPEFDGIRPERPEEHLLGLLADTDASFSHVDSELAGLAGTEELEERLRLLDRQIAENASEINATIEEMKRAEDVVLRADVVIESNPTIAASMTTDDRNGFIRSAEAALQEAEAGHTRASAELAAKTRTAEEREKSAIAARQALDVLEKRLQAIAEQRAELTRQWQEADMPGEPSAGSQSRARTALAEALAFIEQQRFEWQRAWNGHQAWSDSQALLIKETEVRNRMEAAGQTSEAGLESDLARACAACERELEQFDAFKATTQRLGKALRLGSDAFRERIIEPLNALEQKLLAAMNVRLRFELRHETRTAQGKPRLDLVAYPRGAADDGGSGASALHLLSEGQANAFSLARLLAMHLTYRWSRWPALLLDDPMEYNDILRVAAFTDLLRNLVRERHTQVIVTTHDGEIADFMARKFRAGGVEHALYFLQPDREAGVVFRKTG